MADEKKDVHNAASTKADDLAELKAFLLAAPVFSADQIAAIKQARREINK
ncbi:hypothetical protein [Mucilaginibacter celer]|nr:hypothetical protein [Mucilaginibacter celer]